MGGVVKEREEESENERRSVRDITGWGGLIDSGEGIFRGGCVRSTQSDTAGFIHFDFYL